jgi:hypothetical protein
MSSSIAIPRSKVSTTAQSASPAHARPGTHSTVSSSSGSSYDSHSDSSSPLSARSVPFAPSRPSPLATVESTMDGSSSSGVTSKSKDKGRAREDSMVESSPVMHRRTSLMGKELEKVEQIVVEVGSPEAPRWVIIPTCYLIDLLIVTQISCVSSSQGFNWNRSLFLPPYLARDDDLEIRQDPITDVLVSEEETRALLPDW